MEFRSYHLRTGDKTGLPDFLSLVSVFFRKGLLKGPSPTKRHVHGECADKCVYTYLKISMLST
jgi:hypothetical protein